jgi:hypothetical protein
LFAQTPVAGMPPLEEPESLPPPELEPELLAPEELPEPPPPDPDPEPDPDPDPDPDPPVAASPAVTGVDPVEQALLIQILATTNARLPNVFATFDFKCRICFRAPGPRSHPSSAQPAFCEVAGRSEVAMTSETPESKEFVVNKPCLPLRFRDITQCGGTGAVALGG